MRDMTNHRSLERIAADLKKATKNIEGIVANFLDHPELEEWGQARFYGRGEGIVLALGTLRSEVMAAQAYQKKTEKTLAKRKRAK